MSESNLPICFFYKREKDERMTEGAGVSEIPNWVDRDSIPQKQASYVKKIDRIAAKLSEKRKNNNQLPSVISLHLNHNASAKGSRQNIAYIFNDKGAINLIGVTGNNCIMVKVNTPAEAGRIAGKIKSLHTGDKTYLGTYDKKTKRDTSKRNIKNPIGADGRQNLLNSSLYGVKAQRDTETSYASERMLVDYGDKFQPTKKWNINLEELKQSSKERFLKAPKAWYLKIEGLYRQFIEELNSSNDESISQDFCLIITIRDCKRKHDIYDEVTQQLDNNGFIHNTIKVEQQVYVSAGA